MSELTSQEKFDTQHVEEHFENKADGELGLTSSNDEEVVYPEALRNMPEPPSIDCLREGLKMQGLAQSMTLGEQVRGEWKLILCSIPYLIAV